jgi:hypothetical protein
MKQRISSRGRSRNHGNGDRAGAAIVELTLSIPLLIAVVFAGVEASNSFYLQQVITEASYQGTLTGLRPESTWADVMTSMEDMLAARGIIGAELTVEGSDGSDFDSLLPGAAFKVVVEIPAPENTIGPTFSGKYQTFGTTAHAIRP